jgi:hypothetical protein
MACPHEDDHRLVERLLAMYLDGADPSRIVSALGEEQTRRLKQLREDAREAETYHRLVAKYDRKRIH